MKNSVKRMALLLLFLPVMACSQSWQAESGDKEIAVLELFSAEGCGNCPRAYRWIKDLPNQGITGEDVIVLSFHIDYLNDSKGWVDRFASPIFSARQSQLAQINLYKTMYTPEFSISGEIIHAWEKHAKDVIHAVNKFKPEADISLNVTKKNDKMLVESQVNVSGTENRKYSKLYLAITENDIVSKVSGGDNAGATFNHQHLVRKWLGPFELDENGKTQLSTSIELAGDWNLDKLHLVAIVQNLDDGFVLQALALPFSKKE